MADEFPLDAIDSGEFVSGDSVEGEAATPDHLDEIDEAVHGSADDGRSGSRTETVVRPAGTAPVTEVVIWTTP